MTPVIISLPVSPRHHAPLGLYLTAAAVGTLARLTGREALLAVNLIGARAHSDEEAEHYLSHAEAVCGPARHWVDARADWPKLLQEFAARGLAAGWLTQRETAICHCDCGLLEYPAEAPPDLDKRTTGKVYERRSDGLHCLLCGTRAEATKTQSLYLKLPPIEDLKVTPSWAEREAMTFAKEFAHREILISRRRETGLKVAIDAQEFNLDPDLALMLMPFALAHEGLAAETIITGNRTIKQAFLAAAVTHLLGLPTPSIIALPMVTFTDENGQKANLDEEAITTHGGTAVRTVLAMAMGQTPKEMKLATRSLHLATNSLSCISSQTPTAHVRPQQPWNLLGKSKIEALLASLRRRQALAPDQDCILQALCA